LKEQESHSIIRAPTLKPSIIVPSRFLTKLADVRTVVDPFHSIKKPVHAKCLFPPACHYFDYVTSDEKIKT